MEQEHVTVLKLPYEETLTLKDGVNLVNRSENEKYVIYKEPGKEEYRACRNKCKHQGGTFIKDIEDTGKCVIKCTKHGWKLDTKTMRYTNPPDSFRQEELIPEVDDDGNMALVELRPPQPWETDARAKEPLRPGEVKLTYFTHACMELNLGGTIMFTDPWLTGPAFARGWWLMHEPPADWLDRLSKADFIYISHVHSDHLSYPTLELLSARNPDIPIYVGDTSMPVFCKLSQSGVRLNNIHVLQFGIWHEINKDTRFMIMMDGVHPDMDTCILVDYKGHLILNTVDCTNPNGGRLPVDVDIMLSDFAGGASGFPMNFFGGKYTEEWKEQFIKRERKKLLYYKTQVVRDVNPVIYCPFAGYFVEAHPSDSYIRETNTKNDPADLNALIRKFSPEIKTWTPIPGAVLDLQKALERDSDFIQEPPSDTQILKDSWDFAKYVNAVNESIEHEIFSYPEWIQAYYKWVGFHGYNLIVRMIETDDDFQTVEGGYDFLIDFIGPQPTFPQQRPERRHNYLEIRNRIGVHRQTVLKGLFWDDLYIGFNNQISREPDTFHYQFWNHVQILLPRDPPDWDAFLRRMREKNAAKKAVWKPSRSELIQGNGHARLQNGHHQLGRNNKPQPHPAAEGRLWGYVSWLLPVAVAGLAAAFMSLRAK
ncbi:cytidine monophosphate-N-acetylneuraminic acid hydroxylase-like [Diadema antillarum]|uniref:cytidine monophosphate-N-acetylneuraminic acid hydroxylase-like n=1 Tax=Diadema antillarum TaxID=105358 RepID=UPI003A873DD2